MMDVCWRDVLISPTQLAALTNWCVCKLCTKCGVIFLYSFFSNCTVFFDRFVANNSSYLLTSGALWPLVSTEKTERPRRR